LSITTTLLRFEDVPARNAMNTNDLYCQKLELLTHIFAADIVWVYSH